MPSPSLDQNLCLMERRELLTGQKFIAKLGVEALAIAVLPWAARLDERGLCPYCGDPLPYGLGDELRTVVGTNMAGHTAQDKQVRLQRDKQAETKRQSG